MAETKTEEEIDPEAMKIALLRAQLKKLTAIEERQESMIEEGVVEPLDPITITTTPKVVKPPNVFKPWFGVQITNDGPNSVMLIVNTPKSLDKEQELKMDETYGVTFKTAVIADIYLYTKTGTATVRIRGER